jgi:tetratricopeptide (TPR) repeat protein
MEEELLGSARAGDLPGAEIPQIYFDYIKYSDQARLPAVFEHNRLDMQGLALLFLEAIALYGQKNVRHTALRSGIARVLSRNQRHAEALELLESGQSHPELFYRDRLLMAHLYRKKGDALRASQAFQELFEKFRCPYALLALSRLQERATGDYESALRSTDALLDLKHGSQSAIFSESALLRRRSRLLARLQRVS